MVAKSQMGQSAGVLEACLRALVLSLHCCDLGIDNY